MDVARREARAALARVRVPLDQAPSELVGTLEQEGAGLVGEFEVNGRVNDKPRGGDRVPVHDVQDDRVVLDLGGGEKERGLCSRTALRVQVGADVVDRHRPEVDGDAGHYAPSAKRWRKPRTHWSRLEPTRTSPVTFQSPSAKIPQEKTPQVPSNGGRAPAGSV